ncbi:MAG: MerR family transcriptional regulator [Lachnospiraceae bacterium]|nr:MerR family transcriptional regulator [Lachnospiraceae bacterium]
MKLQISELAKQTGVSVRTLHYYDTIGLLKPAEVDAVTGYRFYDEASIEKLKEILYYRGMDFPLKEIQALVEEKEIVKKGKLLERHRQLQQQKKQLEQVLSSVEEELAKPMELSPWFDKILKDYNYSGFSYRAGETDFFCAWGMADYENNTPFTINSRFPVSILSSDFIVFCTLLFEEKGLLCREDPIASYVPECKYGKEVKIGHLLDMTSGFSDELVEKWRAGEIPYRDNVFFKKKSLEEVLEIIHYAPLKFPPGSRFEPCGLNTELLGIVLERAGGTSLDVLLRQYIFEPLDMRNTSYLGEADIIGYSMATPPAPIAWDYNDNNTSWGLLSSAEDLKRWFDALLQHKLLSEKGYEILFSAGEKEEFSCGLYRSRSPYRFHGDRNGIWFDLIFDFEKKGVWLDLRNKTPLPDNRERLMYFTIPGCDGGKVRLEAWELDTDTCVKITSMKIFDKNARELCSFPSSENEYLLFVENHGEKRLAGEFVKDEGYYLSLDFGKMLGERFDAGTTYILEVHAECDSPHASQIGVKYFCDGEEQSMGYYIFFNEIQAYDLFLEALGNVMEVVL